MASSETLSGIKYMAVRVRYAPKGDLNRWSRIGREDMRKLLNEGDISHAEHYRALILIDNAYANRIVDCLPAQFRRQILAPMRISA